MNSSDGSDTLKNKLGQDYNKYINDDSSDYGSERFFNHLINTVKTEKGPVTLDHNELRTYAILFAFNNPMPKIRSLLANYFVDMLQTLDTQLIIENRIIKLSKQPSGFGVTNEKDMFIKMLGRYEFHNKDALISLIYYEVFGETDKEINTYVEDLLPQVDLMAVVEDYLVRLNGADPDNKKYINKFIKVLREFAKYVNTNTVVFTEKNRLDTVKKFAEYLYPNYGPYQNIDAAIFTELAGNVAQKTAETLDQFAIDYAPSRAQLFAEIEQDPGVAKTFMKRVKNVEGDRETKRKKLRSVVADVANLAFLVPEKLSRDYLITEMADGALHEGHSMIGIKKKLTLEEKAAKEREKLQRIAEQENQDKIATLKRDIELKNVEKTKKEAEKALGNITPNATLPLTATVATAAGGGNISGGTTLTSLRKVFEGLVKDVSPGNMMVPSPMMMRPQGIVGPYPPQGMVGPPPGMGVPGGPPVPPPGTVGSPQGIVAPVGLPVTTTAATPRPGGGMGGGGGEDDEEERRRKEKEEEEQKRKEEEEEEQKRKEEEEEEKKKEEEDDEKEMDEKEIDEDIKLMNDYKKSVEKLETVKNMVVEVEDAIVRFKPTLDKYTVESPLISLEQVNRDYQNIKLKKATITKDFEKFKTLIKDTKIKSVFDTIYKIYSKDILDNESKLRTYADTTTGDKDIIDIRMITSINSLVSENKNIIPSLISNFTVELKSEQQSEEPETNNTKKATKLEELSVQNFKELIKKMLDNNDYLYYKKELFLKLITSKIQDKEGSYGIIETNIKDFSDKLKIIFDENYGRKSSYLDSTAAENILREIPKYKQFLQQENDISYEKDIKKNEAASVEGTLESSIDPIELESQTDLLKEQKEKLHEAIVGVKEFVDKIHIEKFKNAWVKDLKELREGGASIENLLQNLIDRTTKAMDVISKKLQSIHGITTEQSSSQSNNAPATGEPEGKNYGEERRGFFGMGGQPKEDVNDPQTAYKLLIEKITKLKEMIEQLISFAQRNSNSVALMATNGEPSMFVQLYNKYIEDRADPKISKLEASEGLIEGVNANQLSPHDILKPTIVDKTVFVALMLIMRLFAMSFANFLIDKKKLKSIEKALAVYLSLYTGIFLLIVLLVNLDTYRLRIIFNYINIHGGYSAVIGHVLVIWLFATLIFIVLRNIRIVNNPKNTKIIEARTSEERSKLRKRLSVISMIIFLFATIIVYVS